MDEKSLKKLEQNSQAIQIRAGFENLIRLPFIPADIREKINEELPNALPVIKDMVKMKLYELSEKLGTGDDSKTYTLRNGKEGPTLTLWEGLVVTAGKKEMTFPLQKIIERIDKCKDIGTLLAEFVTFKIFNPED